MKNRIIAITALLAVVVPVTLHAQSAPSAQGKIGVISLQAAILNTGEGKKDFAALQAKYQPRQSELQRLQQEIQSIQDQLTKGATTLSDDEQARLNRNMEDKQKLLKRSAEDAQNDSTNDQNEIFNRIGQKMVKIITDYAQKNGYALVLDDQRVPIYFASKDIELTEEIVKQYDAAYPMAEAAAPPKPAAPKPAAPAATTPKPKP
jgi:outer membrane protein